MQSSLPTTAHGGLLRYVWPQLKQAHREVEKGSHQRPVDCGSVLPSRRKSARGEVGVSAACPSIPLFSPCLRVMHITRHLLFPAVQKPLGRREPTPPLSRHPSEEGMEVVPLLGGVAEGRGGFLFASHVAHGNVPGTATDSRADTRHGTCVEPDAGVLADRVKKMLG